jgi:hypothetical protein
VEAFPGQNASGKGPKRAVKRVGVRIIVFSVEIREETRLKSALSKNPKKCGVINARVIWF